MGEVHGDRHLHRTTWCSAYLDRMADSRSWLTGRDLGWLAAGAACASAVFWYTTPRRAVEKKQLSCQASAKTATAVAQAEHFPVYPIGSVRSCFRECRGTPRQGLYAPSTRGKIVFEKRVPSAALDGLQEFSHVWVIFVFHQNTNFHLTSRAHADKGHNFRPKVKPPKLKGKSVGVFATRSPHRPNAVGITLVKIEEVRQKDRTVVISSLDLADGTPILDIKPYVTPYDSVPTAKTPFWCGESVEKVRNKVVVPDNVRSEIEAAVAAGALRHYNRAEDVVLALTELLSTDIRPLTSYRSAGPSEGDMCYFRFDMLRVGFLKPGAAAENAVVVITDILVESERDDRDLRSGKKPRYPRSGGH